MKHRFLNSFLPISAFGWKYLVYKVSVCHFVIFNIYLKSSINSLIVSFHFSLKDSLSISHSISLLVTTSLNFYLFKGRLALLGIEFFVSSFSSALSMSSHCLLVAIVPDEKSDVNPKQLKVTFLLLLSRAFVFDFGRFDCDVSGC